MLIDLADDADIEKKMCESAKEQRDSNQYGQCERNKHIADLVINLKNEIKELSEEYTRYQLMSQGLMAGLSSSQASEYYLSEN